MTSVILFGTERGCAARPKLPVGICGAANYASGVYFVRLQAGRLDSLICSKE
jgi:hypothetical protein